MSDSLSFVVLGVHPIAVGLLLVALVAAVVGVLFARRMTATPERCLSDARSRLDRGDWAGALDAVRRTNLGASPETWQDQRRLLEAECLVAASEAALRERRFEEALGHYKAAAGRLDLDDAEATRRVVEAMLAEARRLSAADPLGSALPELLAHVRRLQSPCPEAAFWFALVLLRRGDREAAANELESAHAATQGRQVDPSLYLGALELRDRRPREALRALADANRVAPQCPLIGYLLGVALIDSGGDVLLAVRALQKAVEVLPRFAHEPQKLWSETLPSESWVRNLARRALSQSETFQCPLGLDRVGEVLTDARLRLAEGLELTGRPAESAPIFAELLRQTGSPAARRGLGLSLAALERYDEAVPHLAAAGDEPRIVGALAASLVHATRDPAGNARKALALIAGRPVRGDAAWAKRAGEVFAAARAAGVAVDLQQATELADALSSAEAWDPSAAAVYDLAAQSPSSAIGGIIPKLYTRAAQQHGVRGANDLALLDAAFADRAGLCDFFEKREWDFSAAERMYLRRYAEERPGVYPSVPGGEYADVAESLLLNDARREATVGRFDAAIAWADLALKLGPDRPAALDLRAELAYRRGNLAQAAEILRRWHVRHPDAATPLVRLGLLEAVAGRPIDGLVLLRQALDRTSSPVRAALAFAAARLALASGDTSAALALTDECLAVDSANPPALLMRTALLWESGQFRTLTELASKLAAIDVDDPQAHYLIGVAAFAAGDRDQAEYRAGAARSANGQHLLGLVYLQKDDVARATVALAKVDDGPSHDHAIALRGQLAWRAGDYREALQCWQAVPAAARKSWHVSEILPGTLFLAGVQAFHDKKPEDAAKFLKTAVKAGLTDPRAEPLLAVASQLVGSAADTGVPTLARLEQALASGGPQPLVVWRLARTYRLYGRLADARRTLDLRPDDGSLTVERGLLALAEGRLVVAERHFAAAHAAGSHNPAAIVNLTLTRLSLGRLTDAVGLLPLAAEVAPTAAQRRLFAKLAILAAPDVPTPADWSAEDDRALAHFFQCIGRLEPVESLFDALAVRRGLGPALRQAREELQPLRAKRCLDRGDSAGANAVLAQATAVPVVRNLQGVTAAVRQEFATAARYFHSAQPSTGGDARVEQNLGLVYDWLGESEKAAVHWNRFLESFAVQVARPKGLDEYYILIRAIVRESLLERTAQRD